MKAGILRRCSARWLVVSVVILVALLSAACGPATPPPEPVTISFAFPDTDEATYQRLADAFHEENPYITIELRPRPWGLLEGINLDESDVFLTSQFAIAWLQSQDRVLNLTPFIENDETVDPADYYPGTIDLFSVDGQIWAVPAGVDMMVMYYNQDLFNRYGAPHPQIGWDWDGFLAAASSVRSPEDDVYGYGPNIEMFDPMLFIYQHGGQIFDDLQNPTRTTFNDPLNIEALEWYFRLMHDYNVAPTPQDARRAFGGTGSLYEGVWAEKVGMWTGFLSDRGGRSDPPEWPINWGVVPMARGRQAATMALLDAYFISADTVDRDASWKWVSYLSDQLPQRLAPVRRSLAESSDYEQMVGADIAAVARSSMEGALLLSPELVSFESALGVLQNAFEEIANGRMTPAEAMDWAQARFE